jgi:hypothetical protein
LISISLMFQLQRTLRRSDSKILTIILERVFLRVWRCYIQHSKTNIISSILEDFNLVFSSKDWVWQWTKQFSSGAKNFAKKLTVISLRKIMHTILDICSDKRVKEMIIDRGIVWRLSLNKLLVKESIMDAHSKLLERIS